MPRHMLAFAGLFSAAMALCSVVALAYEQPPTFTASRILPPELQRGPDFFVEPTVTNNSRLNRYRMKTSWGSFTVDGTELLRVRVREVAATARLEHIGGAGSMLQSAGKTALQPVATARDLVVAPAKTVRDTFAGVGNVFGEAGASLHATDPHREGAIASITGASAARRQFAHSLDVDPYTTFPPLDAQLKRLATVDAIGNTAANVGVSFVTGGAGIAISVTSGSSSVRALLRDKDAAALEKIGRQELAAMGVAPGAADAFYANPWLTPADKAILVESLYGIRTASDPGALVRRAAQSSSYAEAFFFRRQAELLAAYHQRVAPIRGLFAAGDLVMARSDHGVVGIFPMDYVVWTPAFERIVAEANGRHGPAELWVTGSVSPETAGNLQRLGWHVSERIGPRFS